MSSDIVKEAVFDGRIIQSRPKFAVDKGALSITNAPFTAISETSSQHTYNIYVPSENVFVDRALEWSSSCYTAVSWTNTVETPANGSLGVALGNNLALCAFPLNFLCSTMTTTINDTTSVINAQDVQREVLRMVDYKGNRLQRTCPTMLDKYLNYGADNAGAINNPNSFVGSQTDVSTLPNGAFNSVFYTNAQGVPLAPNTTNAYSTGSGASLVQYNTDANGVPQLNANAPAGTSLVVYVAFRSTEKLVLSPFIYSDVNECDTGLFGINNIQLIMNLRSPQRVWRFTNQVGALSETVQGLVVSYQTTAFRGSIVNTQFLTPSLEVALPPKSVVPYMEFPRYITNSTTPIPANGIGELQSQTITLPQIPDLLIIYVKPLRLGADGLDPYDNRFGDWYLPPATATLGGGRTNPLSVQFDNFSGLLSSHTSEQLYGMSVRNGLEMDYQQWSGKAMNGYGENTRSSMSGGFLVLKPGTDITLQSGQAPSLVGNYTLQFRLNVFNPFAEAVGASMYVITVNSGFFESIRGSSRIIKGVLSEQDIISAPLAPVASHAELKRVVGGKGLMSSLGNILSKARDVYHATKPAVSAMKHMMPEQMRQVAEAVGYGNSGGSSGGMSGGRSGGRSGKKSIADRIM
jgi:hypothetical protein